MEKRDRKIFIRNLTLSIGQSLTNTRRGTRLNCENIKLLSVALVYLKVRIVKP